MMKIIIEINGEDANARLECSEVVKENFDKANEIFEALDGIVYFEEEKKTPKPA